MIEFRHMQKAFGTSVVLKDINATVNEGDSIAVIGPSVINRSADSCGASVPEKQLHFSDTIRSSSFQSNRY